MDSNIFGNKALPNGDKLQIPLSVEFAELPVPAICSGCTSFKKVGLAIEIAQKLILICPSCLGGMVIRYQQENPEETIIQIDTRVEGPEAMEKIERLISKYVGNMITSKEKAALADDILLAFDEKKWNSM
jgi:hypothetical protein